MCLVLDTNAFSAFFDSNNTQHKNYKPAFDWVLYGKGMLVYGGSKYKKEMKCAHKYIRFFASLDRAGKLVRVCDKNIDNYEKSLIEIEPNKDFDDPHLVAIVLESKCNIICTNDKRAIPYLKNSMFYKGKTKKPRIYQSARNISLLSEKYIADICMPCRMLNKVQISNLNIP